MSIVKFRGDHFFLSNFYPAPICHPTPDGNENGWWPTSEHLYQACKAADPAVSFMIWKAQTPTAAKKLGAQCVKIARWDDLKLHIMASVLSLKFRQNAVLREKLLATGDEDLVESNTWNDIFWGRCRGVGANHLGRLLMELRAELRKETSSVLLLPHQ